MDCSKSLNTKETEHRFKPGQFDITSEVLGHWMEQG